MRDTNIERQPAGRRVTKNLLKSLLLSAGAVGFAGAAMAADVVRPPPVLAKPVIVAPYNWSGHYIGVQGGWDNNHADDVAAGGAADANGAIYGVFGGVNWQHTGNWVFGIDGSFNWSNASGTNALGDTFDADWKGFLRARLGLAFGRILLYGTFGGAVARFNENFTPASETDWGWGAGAGVDIALHAAWFLRADWYYQNYGDVGTTMIDVSANTYLIGLGIKF
jgi:outer membrane immunogenic protein